MTVCGAAAVFCRLMLILGLVGNVFSAKDVCQGKNILNLVGLLKENEVKKIQENIERKVLLKEMVQSILECKTQISTVIKQTEKGDEVAETLGKLQSQIVDVTLNAEKSTNDLVKQQNQAIMSQLEQITKKLEKMEINQASLKSQVQENAIAIKRPGCQKLLQWSDVKKSNLFSAAGKYYYYYNTTTDVTWYKARDWCTERGMRLASLKTLSEIEAVDKELKKRGFTYFWVSASDIGRAPGKFHWLDGTPVDSTVWDMAYGQPDHSGAGKEACAFLHTEQGKLWDWPCSYTSYILCELPTALSTCL